MLLFDGILIALWITALVVLIRLIFNSGNLHLNSNRILLFIFGIYTFGICRHISMDLVEKFYGVNFPIGLIFNTSYVVFIPILFFLYVKKTISNENAFNTTDTLNIVVGLVFFVLFQLPFEPEASQLINLSKEDIYWANYFNARKIPNWLVLLRNILNVVYLILTYKLLLNTFKVKLSSKEDGMIKKFINKFIHIKSSSKQIEQVKTWLYNLTYMKTLMSLFTLYFSIRIILYKEVFFNGQHLVSSFLAFLYFGLFIFIHKNKNVLYNLPSFMNEDSLKREKIREEIKVEEIYKYIVNQIKEHELYLNDQFKLDWLANELEIKAEYISVTLKENNFDNFKMFTNHLRVKKAKKLIKQGYLKNYNIEALAKACWFQCYKFFL